MRKTLLVMLGVLFLAGQLWAQNRTITGKVTDAQGKGIPNASVRLKGTNTGTATSLDGSYSLPVSSNKGTLVISSIGYADRELEIGNKTTLSISLTSNNQDLNEVIVVAYGTVKKGDNTGSSAQISAKDLEKRPISNVLNALAGSAPGIQTTAASGQPGSSPTIRIRGYTSYSANSSPLIVVDGAVFDAGIANINPEDVETMSTGKDAATTALYGSRGANGVIFITTKKGKHNRSALNFKATKGVTQRGLPEYERVDAFQYYPLMWEAYKNNLVYGSSPIPAADAAKIASGVLPRFTTGANAGRQNYNGVAYSDIRQLLGYNPFNVDSASIVRTDGTINPSAQLLWGDDLDWAGAATNGGNRQEYNLSYSGGSEKSDYYGSFNYNDEKGYLINSGMKRFAGRVSVNTQPLSWFRTGFNISGANNSYNNGFTDGGTSIVNPFYFTRYIGPIYPIYAHNPSTGAYLLNSQGERYYDYGNSGTAARPYSPGRHTIAENLWNERMVKRNALSARTFGDVIFTSWLKFTTNLSYDVQDYLYQEYDNKIVGDGSPSGRSRRTATKTSSYTFNQLLNFNQKFGSHNISALAGHENYDYTYNYLYGSKQGQIVDGITEFDNFSTTNSISSRTDRYTIESYLSRLAYDYKSTYFLTGSLRRDGNSKFSKDVRWKDFWSVGAAWRMDNEAFLQKVSWIDQLKLRASYGSTGNDGGIGYYPYQSLYNLGNNNGLEPGFTQGSLGNDSLTWETVKSLDFGVDFSFFKNRLNGTVEYFNRVTDGLIFSVPQPLSNGGTSSGSLSVRQNIGNLYNRGVEIQIGGDIIRNKDFSWNMNVNWTKFKNEITKMPPGRAEIIDGTKKLSVGHSIYDFWLRHYYGVDPTDGAALYAYTTYSAANCRILDNGKGSKDTVTTDINNAKLIYTGDVSTPDFYGSVINTFSYKGFQLSFTLVYQVGGKIYDGSYASLMSAGSFGTASHIDMLNRWQKPGDITNVPRLDYGKTGVFDAASDRWLTDASYLNINNVNLAYSIPKNVLSKIKATAATLFLSAENLHLFTKRKGMSAGSSFNGTTDNSYNVSRILTAGINLSF